MRALGLDPSLNSYGWAIHNSSAVRTSDRLVASGHEGTLSSTVPVVRYMHFRALVNDLLDKYPVDVVGLESPAYGGGEYSERHFGLMMFSLEAIFEHRIDCVLFDPTTLKFLAGNARADKAHMQRFAKLDQMSANQMQSDEADAYCVAKFATRFLELHRGIIQPDDLTDPEKRVFLERQKKTKRLGKMVIKRTAHIFRENNRFFQFSKIPAGNINLPTKSQIDDSLLKWLEED